MTLEIRPILEHHARLKKGWEQQLRMLESGMLTTRSKGASETWKDTTGETVHFIRTQISVLDALDRLLARPGSSDASEPQPLWVARQHQR